MLLLGLPFRTIVECATRLDLKNELRNGSGSKKLRYTIYRFRGLGKILETGPRS